MMFEAVNHTWHCRCRHNEIHSWHNLIASESGGVRKYYLFNAHGDVVQLADTSGNAVKRYDYDAFGVEKSPDANDTNPFRYCGEYFDKETGTVYLRARYYDPVIGRFTQQDTVRFINQKMPSGQEVVDPLSLNLYTYCGNNPVLYQDESGHAFMLVTAAIGAVAGAVIGGVIAASTGKSVLAGAAIGAAAGGLFGLGAGAAAAYIVAGSVTASTSAVVTGVGAASATAAGGAGGGAAAKKVVEKAAEKAPQITQKTSAVAPVVQQATQKAATVAQKAEPIARQITGYTKHGLNQAIGRDGGLGVSPSAILHTVKNGTITAQANGTFKFASSQAVVALNQAGKVVTTYAKSSSYWR